MQTDKGKQQTGSYDLVVIGGGINGTGIARDAAGRGLSVLLCEQDDLGAHTSSASTKLIHGGLRYLEHFDFKLVRHSLREREVLLRSAPHIIWPMRFILPHHKALRPRWMIAFGLFLYDHLGKRELLPASKSVVMDKHVAGSPLMDQYTHGFEYSDCWVQDARLVVLNALDAKNRGAEIRTRTRCTGVQRSNASWEVELTNTGSGVQETVKASALVNAAGPWVEQVSRMDAARDSIHGVRLVKGSHIIVSKLFDHEYAYIFQNSDGRIQFAIPYEQNFTLLGTTDVEIDGDPGSTQISQSEVEYLCANASNYFRRSVSPEDVVANYSGVRPLFDDAEDNASKATRDYVLQLNEDMPKLLSVYGGKLTTYRILSEQVVDMLEPQFELSTGRWTENTYLPGGDLPALSFSEYSRRCEKEYPGFDGKLVNYYARNYGTRINALLQNRKSVDDLGTHFGALLYEAEVEFLVANEWAITAEDIYRRRTNAGLHGGSQLIEKLTTWFDQNVSQ